MGQMSLHRSVGVAVGWVLGVSLLFSCFPVSAGILLEEAAPRELERPMATQAQAGQKIGTPARIEAQERKRKGFGQLPKGAEDAGKFLQEKFDFSFGEFYEYDDNAFLDETDGKRDVKHVMTPSVFYEQSGEKLYTQGSYQVEATRWTHQDSWIVAQQMDGGFSWDATPKWTLGAKDTHIHTGQDQVGTATGERILRLGFNINTLQLESRYQLTPDTVLHNQYQFDWINFDDDGEQDDFIDRRANQFATDLEHYLKPDLKLTSGYAYRHVNFQEVFADPKSFQSNRVWGGFAKKFARRWTIENAFEFESRDFDDSGHKGSSPTRDFADTGSKGENKGYFNIRSSIQSTFSRFTSAGFGYVRSQGDSSRSEYRQYRSDRLAANLRHYFTPKTIFFGSASWEKQTYDASDQLLDLINFVRDQRQTYLWSGDATLRQILTSVWALELSYHWSKRDSDFAREGYTNNRLRVGLRATF